MRKPRVNQSKMSRTPTYQLHLLPTSSSHQLVETKLPSDHQPTGLASDNTPDDIQSQTDDAHPMASLMPQSSFRDLLSFQAWRNPLIWRAAIIEGTASASLNFLSGVFVATLSKASYPLPSIPPLILLFNTLLITTLISATASSSGAHINSAITLSTLLSNHTHPIQAAIYVLCQLSGGALGGVLLRYALGTRFALEIHNGGCWLDPEGEIGVWQAALIEFTSMFILLFLAYGVGLDPGQSKLFGAKYAPVLVGLVVGLITSLTSILHVGYTGAGLFPNRCLGLAIGILQFQKTHWVWWAPDILATILHALLYRTSPPYVKRIKPAGLGFRQRSNSPANTTLGPRAV